MIFEEYDGVITKPPLNDETLAHYGVVGMKWGVRRDLKRTGSISKKTKSKINKAMSKASYNKSRRMLNAAESLKSDYRGNKEKYKSKGDNAKANKAARSSDEVSKLSKDMLNVTKSKNYEYDVDKNVKRSTGKRKAAIAVPTAILAPSVVGGAAIAGIQAHRTNKKDIAYRKEHNSVNSPYATYDTDMYYSKKKKKS